MTLEQELISIFAPEQAGQRNRDILIGYYGWEDGRPHTLAEIGARFGITRERVRQVCSKLTQRLSNPSTIPAPTLDRTLTLIAQRLPCSAAHIEAELLEQGLTNIGMSIEGVAAGAELLGRIVPFIVVDVGAQEYSLASSPSRCSHEQPHSSNDATDQRLAIHPKWRHSVRAAVELAKKEVYFHGLATIEQIACGVFGRRRSASIPAAELRLVKQTVMLLDGFCWLDERTGWFRLLTIDKHGLPKVIDKVLAVTGSVTVGQLRSALARNPRQWKHPPPENVLLAYCRHIRGVEVEGNLIRSTTPRDWRTSLTGIEAKLVETLKANGPVMDRGMMEDICVSGGMNRFSFHAFISWSPVIVQYGPSIYGLLGSEVSAAQLKELIARRRVNRPTRRVLESHGRTPDGRVWLDYRLSKAASTYAVITVPAALKQTVRGRFQLRTTDGLQIGTLAAKEGRAWGLGTFLRRNCAHVGDRIRLTLDLKEQTATISWNGTKIHRDGSNNQPRR